MPPLDPQQRRRRELAAIHKGAAQLGLDTQDRDPDSVYRTMLRQVGGATSAADLDAAGRRRVLDHLRRLGALPERMRRPRPPEDKAALVAKIRAQLAAAHRADTYADGIAKRMFDIDRFEWCTPEQLHKIVAALAYDAKRNGRVRTAHQDV